MEDSGHEISNLESEVQRKLVAKEQIRRFRRYVKVQQDLLATGKTLVTADTLEEAMKKFNRMVRHTECLWDDACLLFVNCRYATALAVSITCIEETGKIGVARFQVVIDETVRRGGSPASANTSPSRKSNPFYSHHQKLLLAAGAGALVNARLDRILGLSEVVEFLDQVERGEIESLRQFCL